MAPSSDLHAFRETLREAKSVAILAGAGLSAGSGIPTYRSDNGLWKQQDENKVATKDAFKEDPSTVWQFYHYRRDVCLKAEPNAGHHAIASLSLPAVRAKLLPSLSPSQPPLFITQNFDSLSLRALDALSSQLTPDELAAAKERLIEMHGSGFRTVCTQCRHVHFTYDTPLCAALAGLTQETAGTKTIPVEDLPRCGGPDWNGSNRYGRCGGLLRPAITWFGEIPEGLGEIARQLNWTELLIVVGTSSLVYPAAGFAKTVKDRGGKVAIFNLERSSGDDDADFLFLGPCEEILPEAFKVQEP